MIQSYHSQGLRGVVAEVPLLGGGAAGGGHRLCGVVLGLPAQQQHAARVGVPDGVPPPAGEEGVGGGPGARGEGEAAVLRVVPAAVHQPGLAVPVGALALGQTGQEAGGLSELTVRSGPVDRCFPPPQRRQGRPQPPAT